ncbi:DUF3397 domain-containing protein [Rossellomorea marisflavi]|uniref:DUF3397 domain-containing protein n=1 Tax=Rossellomorea marisflavi TaxID=189381 RepID=UPI00345822C3
MASAFSFIMALVVLIPFAGYFISFIMAKELTGSHRKAVHISIDVTTILLMISVHFIIVAIWEQSYFWLILLTVLCSALFFTIVYWRLKGEVDYRGVIRGTWRLNFLLFSFAYLALMVTRLALRVMEST